MGKEAVRLGIAHSRPKVRNGFHRIGIKARSMKISARNQIRGRVTAVRTGSIMAEVEIAVEPSELTAVITKTSVESLGLAVGDDVTVIVKSTEVMVGKG